MPASISCFKKRKKQKPTSEPILEHRCHQCHLLARRRHRDPTIPRVSNGSGVPMSCRRWREESGGSPCVNAAHLEAPPVCAVPYHQGHTTTEPCRCATPPSLDGACGPLHENTIVCAWPRRQGRAASKPHWCAPPMSPAGARGPPTPSPRHAVMREVREIKERG